MATRVIGCELARNQIWLTALIPIYLLRKRPATSRVTILARHCPKVVGYRKVIPQNQFVPRLQKVFVHLGASEELASYLICKNVLLRSITAGPRTPTNVTKRIVRSDFDEQNLKLEYKQQQQPWLSLCGGGTGPAKRAGDTPGSSCRKAAVNAVGG